MLISILQTLQQGLEIGEEEDLVPVIRGLALLDSKRQCISLAETLHQALATLPLHSPS